MNAGGLFYEITNGEEVRGMEYGRVVEVLLGGVGVSWVVG